MCDVLPGDRGEAKEQFCPSGFVQEVKTGATLVPIITAHSLPDREDGMMGPAETDDWLDSSDCESDSDTTEKEEMDNIEPIPFSWGPRLYKRRKLFREGKGASAHSAQHQLDVDELEVEEEEEEEEEEVILQKKRRHRQHAPRNRSQAGHRARLPRAVGARQRLRTTDGVCASG